MSRRRSQTTKERTGERNPPQRGLLRLVIFFPARGPSMASPRSSPRMGPTTKFGISLSQLQNDNLSLRLPVWSWAGGAMRCSMEMEMQVVHSRSARIFKLCALPLAAWDLLFGRRSANQTAGINKTFISKEAYTFVGLSGTHDLVHVPGLLMCPVVR